MRDLIDSSLLKHKDGLKPLDLFQCLTTRKKKILLFVSLSVFLFLCQSSYPSCFLLSVPLSFCSLFLFTYSTYFFSPSFILICKIKPEHALILSLFLFHSYSFHNLFLCCPYSFVAFLTPSFILSFSFEFLLFLILPIHCLPRYCLLSLSLFFFFFRCLYLQLVTLFLFDAWTAFGHLWNQILVNIP